MEKRKLEDEAVMENGENNEENLHENTQPAAKKQKTFSGKEFRNQLQTSDKLIALQKFRDLIDTTTKPGDQDDQDHILAYLEAGGSCIEILQILETETAVPPVLVFSLTNQILLQIGAKHPQYNTPAFDACRYLLNSYVPLVNKMIGLSSTTQERIGVLKLLTTIATYSATLAKEILVNVSFNPTNLELLTKLNEGKSEVRKHFIYFVLAFLVDGQYATLSILLDKKHLFGTLINGLRYDNANLVVLLLNAIKSNILENPHVSKTTKMVAFNTAVIKDIVNLYNWKGPGGIDNRKNRNKTKLVVDELEKSRVNEALHLFLLTLCASHKFGIIFRDKLVGLGRTSQNTLMQTVLNSLERPWEHSYAGELVLSICAACPDLGKIVWTSLRAFLEPRLTVKWLKALEFASKLLDTFRPDSIEFCFDELTAQQLVNICGNLVVPGGVLKQILPEQKITNQYVRYKVLGILHKMSETLCAYVKKANTKKIDFPHFKATLENLLIRTFPDALVILENWDADVEFAEITFEYSKSSYLEVCLNILENYKTLAPKLNENLTFDYDIKELLAKIAVLDHSQGLHNQITNFFLDLNPTIFSIQSDLFEISTRAGLEYYFQNRNKQSFEMLQKLVSNTGLFENNENEMRIWINGVLNAKKFHEEIGTLFIELLKKANNSAHDSVVEVFVAILTSTEISKNVKNYTNFVVLNLFHLQRNALDEFLVHVNKIDFLPTDLVAYLENWSQGQICALKKGKYILEHSRNFSKDFFENNFQELESIHPDFRLNLLQTTIFYLSSLVRFKNLKQDHIAAGLSFIKKINESFVDENFVATVLQNEIFLQNFQLNTNDLTTKFLNEFVDQHLSNSEDTDKYLTEYRSKIVSLLKKTLKHPEKFDDANTFRINVLETFKLEPDACGELLEKIAAKDQNSCFYRITSYCLNQIKERPLDGNAVKSISRHLATLAMNQSTNLAVFSTSLLNYLKIFPHNIDDIDSGLLKSLLALKEFDKDNLSLCVFLLSRKKEFVEVLEDSFSVIAEKKSFLLALLPVVLNAHPKLEEKFYESLLPTLMKVLEKPHKASQQFSNYYKEVGALIEKYMKKFTFKAAKYESTEVFHVYILKKCFEKLEDTPKNLTNKTLTFVKLLTPVLKQNPEKIDEVSEIFYSFLSDLKNVDNIPELASNETFQQFCKLSLKHGVSGVDVLLKILTKLVTLSFDENSARIILEMLLSHSQFLDRVLGEENRDALLDFWLTLYAKWPHFIEKSHISVILSAYKGTRRFDDTLTLKLLQLCESHANQTRFFDYKPFLWGEAAAAHYSVRRGAQNALWRQPKMADVLDNLNEERIKGTILNEGHPNGYDLKFFLPLFSQLLAPENPVHTYRFTKSGALALTITALRDEEKNTRLAACYVISRFQFHLEAKQKGKDTPLWLRFIDAIHKGVSQQREYRLNNFVTIFWARAALILTNPGNVMYLPISQYLSAKSDLKFASIPELYTFLHSSDVNCREHRQFLFGVLKKGLRSEADFDVFLKTMGMKLVSEFANSSVCDFEGKLQILEVFEACVERGLGLQVLKTHSFLTWLFNLLDIVLKDGGRGGFGEMFLGKTLRILLKFIDDNENVNFLIFYNLIGLLETTSFRYLKNENKLVFYQILNKIVDNKFTKFFTNEILELLSKSANDSYCKYLLANNCKYVNVSDFGDEKQHFYFVRLLFFKLYK